MKGTCIVAFGVIVGFPAGLPAQAPAPAAAPVTVIQAARMLDGRSDLPIRNVVIVLGLSGEIGTLEGGKEADIVAVPGNPLEKFNVTERVPFVMKGGQVVPGKALSARLTHLRS